MVSGNETAFPLLDAERCAHELKVYRFCPIHLVRLERRLWEKFCPVCEQETMED
jgi:hypothetical protein